MTAPAPRPAAVPLTSRDIEEIEGIADLGMPIGGTLVGRLCADWRRLTAERDAARAALPDAETLERAATTIEGGGYHFLARELSDAAERIRARGEVEAQS